MFGHVMRVSAALTIPSVVSGASSAMKKKEATSNATRVNLRVITPQTAQHPHSFIRRQIVFRAITHEPERSQRQITSPFWIVQ
jgi:hypothetical protein